MGRNRAAGEQHHYESPLKAPPHFPAQAKRVIFLFMQGAPSHVDTFDYKPEFFASDGKKVGGRSILAPQWKFKPHGQSGLYISELFPMSPTHADQLCLMNSMFIDNPAHPQATIQLHTGSAVRPPEHGIVDRLWPGDAEPESAWFHHHQPPCRGGWGAELRHGIFARSV